MAGPQGVSVQGVQRFRSTWDRAVREIEDFTDPNRATAQLVQNRARQRAPRLTGRLAASIGMDVDGADAFIGSDLIYAPVQHYGWPAHHIAPRPFLADAAHSAQGQVPTLYLRHLDQALRKVRGV